MTLYIQDENYHFDGFISGVIVDNQRTAIFKKEGIEEHNLEIDFNCLLKIYISIYIFYYFFKRFSIVRTFK
jgi:hypothetical protein